MTMIATYRDSVGRGADRMLRQFGPRSEADVLDLLGSAGGPRDQFFQAVGRMLSPPPAWTAGFFVANEIRGVVCAARVSEGRVEANICVDEAWRRQGIGSALLKQAMDWVSSCDAHTLRFVCERTDWPMRHFARKFGARLDLVLGQIVIDIPVVRVHQ
jgi:GNAT superfamily N-acetyltransferase